MKLIIIKHYTFIFIFIFLIEYPALSQDRAFDIGPNLSLPAGKIKLGKFALGADVMGIFYKQAPWAIATDLGYIHLFSKSYQNTTGQTFHTKPINEFYLQAGPRYYFKEKQFFADLLFGTHIALTNSSLRSGKALEYINDFTLNFGYHYQLSTNRDMSLVVFFARYKSNGDGMNYAGIKFLCRVKWIVHLFDFLQ